MTPGGFAGRILHLDLTNRRSWIEPLDLTLARAFGGGIGLSIRLAHEHAVPNAPALSPENVIVLGAGPMVGTSLPASSRIFAVSKFPATGGIGWCGAGGMNFGCMLKHAGFDHIVIRGRSKRPAVVTIRDGEVELRDAGDLWGRGIRETCRELWNTSGRGAGVVAIGQAGETLCSFAMAYVDGISTLGRGGFGAVMGSKNLKAIVVKGSRGIGVAQGKRFREMSRDLMNAIRSYPYLKEWQDLGLLKSLPVIDAGTYRRMRKGRIACVSCPIGDKDLIEIPDGEFQGFSACTSSVVNLLTPLIYRFADYRHAAVLTATLDDLGLDMFEFFGLMGFLRELVAQGIAVLGRGEPPVVMDSLSSLSSWAHLISTRTGLGEVLSGGMSALLGHFGRAAEELAPPVVRGMLPYVGPSAALPWNLFGTMELGQTLDPRGPHVAAGGSPTYFAKRELSAFPQHMRRMGIPDEAIPRILTGMGSGREDLRVGRLLKHSHTWFTILGSLGICARAQINRFYSAPLCAGLYEALTGMETDVQDLRTRADRAWTLLRMANIREGITAGHETAPGKWFGPSGFRDYVSGQPIGPDEARAMREDYYQEQGWDQKTGLPTGERLEELGLGGEDHLRD